jgi:hypothetical protein
MRLQDLKMIQLNLTGFQILSGSKTQRMLIILTPAQIIEAASDAYNPLIKQFGKPVLLFVVFVILLFNRPAIGIILLPRRLIHIICRLLR